MLGFDKGLLEIFREGFYRYPFRALVEEFEDGDAKDFDPLDGGGRLLFYEVEESFGEGIGLEDVHLSTYLNFNALRC